MPFYTVPMTGAGTDADPFRPDLPAGTSYVGTTIPTVDGTGTEYVLFVNGQLATGTQVNPTELRDRLALVGLTPKQLIDSWKISGAKARNT